MESLDSPQSASELKSSDTGVSERFEPFSRKLASYSLEQREIIVRVFTKVASVANHMSSTLTLLTLSIARNDDVAWERYCAEGVDILQAMDQLIRDINRGEV